MNSKKIVVGVMAVLVLMLGLTAGAQAKSIMSNRGHGVAPDQPRMQAALTNLEAAQRALENAQMNKGGHRVKALEYVGKAINEVNKGIEYDRKHDHASLLRGASASAAATTTAPIDQPRMREALNHLQEAQGNLQNATSDKGGHRAKALEYVGKAIVEVNEGMSSAR